MTINRIESVPDRRRLHRANHDNLEELVPDGRATLKPSEIVQTKLLSLLPDTPVPVSCLHSFRDTRRGSIGPC